jgi:hypothetical protein
MRKSKLLFIFVGILCVTMLGCAEWFEETMLQMGFNQNETDDFIEYWVEPEDIVPFDREGFTVVEWGVYFDYE